MLLDSGICSVFRKCDTSGAGEKPAPGYTLIFQSWYGELSFETAPAFGTKKREDVKTDARIRIQQNRRIGNHDVVVLCRCQTVPEDCAVYEITRAYHGDDPDSGQPITDLLLEVVEG